MTYLAGAYLITSSCCILFLCSCLMAPTCSHNDSRWKQFFFKFYFADFLEIWLKFAKHLDGNQATVTSTVLSDLCSRKY